MKKCLLLIVILCAVASARAGDSSKEWYKKHKESAHPTPLNLKKSPAIPLADPEYMPSFFLNVNTVADQEEALATQNESSIAVNPKDKNFIVGSAVDYRANSATWVYYSEDGGHTWINKNLGRPYTGWRSSNDPSVAFDEKGTAFMVYGGFGPDNDSVSGENGVFLARSFDKGKTWEAHIPIIVHLGMQTKDSSLEDKYYISVDKSPSSPYYNHLYVPWKRVTNKDSATQIVISKSTDGGATWSEPLPISPRLAGTSEDTTYGQSFPLASCGPNGEVYVVWNNGIVHGVGFAKSLDGGKTFSNPEIIKRYNIFGETKNLEGQGWRHSLKGIVRAEAYPVIATDINVRKNNIYIAWAADNPPNIWFSKSTDKGETWSEAKILHNEIKNDQYWQWLAVDPISGDIAASYLDSRNYEDNILSEAYVSYSHDGGDTWIDRRVSDIGSDLRRNPFLGGAFAGDYNGCAFYDGIIYPSWVDMRNASQQISDDDVYTAVINTKAPEPPYNFEVTNHAFQPQVLDLKWEHNALTTFGKPLPKEEITFKIYRNGIFVADIPAGASTFKDTGLVPFAKQVYSISAFYKGDSSIKAEAYGYPGGAKSPAPPIIVSSDRGAGNILNLKIDLPSMRADNITPLVNLSALDLYRDNILIKKLPLEAFQAGKQIEILDTVPEMGYYQYAAKAEADYEASEIAVQISDFSAKHLAYAGISEDRFEENFDSQIKKIYKSGSWDTTSSISKSTPYSISNGASGPYNEGQRDTLLLFPVIKGSEALELSFWHAAFVRKSDSCFIEYSSGAEWKRLGFFDKESYSQWSKSELKSSNMVFSFYKIEDEPAGKEIVFRFRFAANLIGADKGWFIDDIKVQPSATGIEDNYKAERLALYPNPVKDVLNFVYTGSDKIKSIKVFNYLGQEILNANYELNSSDKIDCSYLTRGVYLLELKLERGAISKIFSVN